jgi:integrase
MSAPIVRKPANGVTDHGVRLLDPTDKKSHYRITWVEDGKRKETTASDPFDARNKQVQIEKRLSTENGHRSLLTVQEMIDAYIKPEKGELTRNRWSPKHLRSVKQIMDAEVPEDVKQLQCSQLQLHHLEAIVKKSRSTSMAEHWISVLNAFVTWGYNNGWILNDPVKWTTALNRKLGFIREENASNIGARTKDVVTSGESRMYIHADQIPSHEHVHALGKAAAKVTGDWRYELLINLAAYSGLRDGEIFDLDVDHVDADLRDIYVETQRLDDAGNLSRTYPKKRKRRRTTYVEVTPMGYELAEKLKERIAELNEMKEAPLIKNGERRKLLFPNSKGSWISNSNFAKRVRLPAQELAGWPKRVLTKEELRIELEKREERARRKKKKLEAEAKAAKERGEVLKVKPPKRKKSDSAVHENVSENPEQKEPSIEPTFMWNFHSLRHVFCSYMINELKCAPIDVSIAAGHENISTTLSMYVSASASSLDRLKASTEMIKKVTRKPRDISSKKKPTKATKKKPVKKSTPAKKKPGTK